MVATRFYFLASIASCILLPISSFVITSSKRSIITHRTTDTGLKMGSLPESELQSILDIATAAAKKAGEIIVQNSSGADVTKTKANSKDLLTMIDPMCEKIIKETVLAEFPTHDFLGEEDVPAGKEASAAALDAKLKTDKDFLWIVDVSQLNLFFLFIQRIKMCRLTLE